MGFFKEQVMAKKWEDKKKNFERIELIPEAADEYNNLDGSVRKEVDKKFAKLNENPYLGLPLGNRNNMDLTGFYKLYLMDKKVRTVYRIIDSETIEIVEVWGIGKRDKMEVYKDVDDRKQQ